MMKELRETDRQALLKLLTDDDAQMRQLLETTLLEMGAEGRTFLEAAAREGPEESQRGAQQILQAIRARESQEAFARFCAQCGDRFDLERACWLLTKTRYPDLDETPYRARLDQMARELQERLTMRETPRATVEVINHYLFRLLEFRGNRRDYYDADNSYLNRVLDRRLGNPITLSAVYLTMGARLALPLHGINLPGHFLVKWQSGATHFFIDPFNEGQLLDEAECRRMCERLARGFSPAYLAPATPRQILRRMCRNLEAIYADHDPIRAEQCTRFIGLLSPPRPQATDSAPG